MWIFILNLTNIRNSNFYLTALIQIKMMQSISVLVGDINSNSSSFQSVSIMPIHHANIQYQACSGNPAQVSAFPVFFYVYMCAMDAFDHCARDFLQRYACELVL